MIVALVLLVPLLAGALYVYFRFSPSVEPSRLQSLKTFNVGILLGALLGCIGIGFYFKTMMSGGSDAGWWPILTVLCSLFFLAVLLFVGWVMKGFVFRK